MPSKSIDQRNYIFSQRGKYKSKENTPGNMKWIWDDEWKKIESKGDYTMFKLYKRFFEDFNQKEYLKWKLKNVSFRGMKEIGKINNSGANMGNGLYSAVLSNKAMAKAYGDVYFAINAVPKKPKIVNSVNSWEIFLGDIISNFCKKHGLNAYDPRFFYGKTNIEDEVQKLGYDGVIIKGREMVNYKPENVIYFKTENEVRNYYEIVILKKGGIS